MANKTGGKNCNDVAVNAKAKWIRINDETYKWSKNKESYAEKSNRIWIAITEKNVKGMCNYTKN